MVEAQTDLVIMTDTVMPNIRCSRVLIRSMPSNVADAWLKINGKAKAGYCYPLSIGDGIELAISNLNKLDFAFEEIVDKIALIYEA